MDSSSKDEENLLHDVLGKSLSSESQKKVRAIVTDIDGLSKTEQLLLYLELPSVQNGSHADPLKQPINPLGSRSEIQLTITWIKTHLEEDQQVSLPKHEVYDEYTEYCNDNGLKALSTADFGKVMKQVYPQVRPRRLGTRGNSRYCYAGLRKKVKLEEPCTPDFLAEFKEDKITSDQNVEEAATYLILEWVEKLFNEKMESIRDLALFLIEKMYVDNRSVAAHALMSSAATINEKNSNQNSTGVHLDNNEASKRKSGLYREKDFEKKKRLCDDDRFPDEPATNYPALSFAESERSSRIIVEKTTPDNDWEKPEDKSSSAEVNEEVTGYFGNQNQGGIDVETEQTKKDKLSQLRQLLEKNLKSAVSSSSAVPPDSKIVVSAANSGSAFRLATSSTSLDSGTKGEVPDPSEVCHDSSTDTKISQREWDSMYPPGTSSGDNQGRMTVGTSLCQRRRVSFNPLVVQDTSSGNSSGVMGNNSSSSTTIGGGNSTGLSHPSPGTRKRHFSFQPISPRQNSLPQSPVASPFISPRSTPIHMLRSRHSSGSALPLHLLPGQSGSSKVSTGFNSASSDISQAATFGSTSECSTPFISPHGTPVPFNRSRHNSAQGRLCRSRHSSGLGLGSSLMSSIASGPHGRGYNMTFSPMALNNLNNPYSPQPSTPVGSIDADTVSILDPSQQNIAQFQASERSRHSSAESEPALGNIVGQQNFCSNVTRNDNSSNRSFSSVIDGSVRQRHASAGQVESTQGVMQTVTWMEELNSIGNVQDSQGRQDGANKSLHKMSDGPSSSDGAPLPDDLDMALSALKDCDNEFSKFVAETEEN